jgi:hypothetical protein
MYSVFRATSKNVSVDFINEVGKNMNIKKENIYQGSRKAGDGFSCDISKSVLWTEQTKEITCILKLFNNEIKLLKSNGYEAVIDIAIDSADLSKQKYGLFLFQNNCFIKEIAAAGIDYEISIYK